MHEIGPLLQLPEVHESEEAPNWVFVWHDGTVVAADYEETEQRLTLSTDVGAMPEEDSGTLANLLLAYNYQWPETGGVRAAVNDGQVFLLYDLFAADLDSTRLGKLLSGFAQRSAAWRELVEQACTAPERAQPQSAPESLGDIMRMGIRA